MKHLIAPLTAGFCIALGLGSASAADLTKIERSLLKEPAYQTKNPKYGLLVFGADAKIRLWLVLDGDVMYLDRNGTGDLTEPNKRIAAKLSRHYPDVPRPELAARREFVMDRLPRPNTTPPKDAILSCIPTVKWFDVEQEIFRDDYLPKDEREQAALDHLRKRPVRVALFLDDRKFEQDGYADFADHPQNAPIIHFDGPLTLRLDEAKFGPLELRRGETSELYVKLMTPGLDATTVVQSYSVPDSGHPVVEIDWPVGGMSESLPGTTIALTERC
jgi:hypothetical protein